MDEYRIKRDVICIDLKSFYASAECVMRGLDPFKTPLIVADESRGGGSVVLAVTPYLKARGFKNRARLHEVPSVEGLIIAKPRMRKYLEFSRDIVAIYLSFVAKEDLHIYSIDEAFLDLTAYKRYYGAHTRTIAKRIMRTIYEQTGIPSTCGIGDNLLLSKLALDLESKASPTHIGHMHYEDVAEKLWKVRPLSEMWGIGPRMQHRLNMLGFYSVGDIARSTPEHLAKHFGIIGEEVYYHAHGIDQSIIANKAQDVKSPMKSVGLGQTLFSDYDAQSIFTVMLEMIDEVGERLRFIRKQAKTMHLAIGYSKATGGGFSRQWSFTHATDDVEELLEVCLRLFNAHYEDLPIRRISIRATNLKDTRMGKQVSFFKSIERKEKTEKLFHTIDHLRRRYGKRSVMRLTSYFESGTAAERAKYIGGHHA